VVSLDFVEVPDVISPSDIWNIIDHGVAIQSDPVVHGRGNLFMEPDDAYRITVFAVGTDGHLYEVYWNGSQWTLSDRGGSLMPGLLMIGRGNFATTDFGIVNCKNVVGTSSGGPGTSSKAQRLGTIRPHEQRGKHVTRLSRLPTTGPRHYT
jgi:hypothetical protein